MYLAIFTLEASSEQRQVTLQCEKQQSKDVVVSGSVPQLSRAKRKESYLLAGMTEGMQLLWSPALGTCPLACRWWVH